MLSEKLHALIEASKALLAKHDAIVQSPSFKSVFQIAAIHGCAYSGPVFAGEEQRLSEALAALPDLSGYVLLPIDMAKRYAAALDNSAQLLYGYETSVMADEIRSHLAPIAGVTP